MINNGLLILIEDFTVDINVLMAVENISFELRQKYRHLLRSVF